MYFVFRKPEMGDEGHYHLVKQFKDLFDAQAWVREQFGYYGPLNFTIAGTLP